jgi:membrane fusion protein, multidrug efflux system
MTKKSKGIDLSIRYLTVIVGIIFLVSCGKKEEKADLPAQERPVRVIILEGGSGAASRSYSGKTEAKDTVDASFEVAGKIIELPIQRGMTVAAGDVIAKLDARDFENDLAAKKSQYEKAFSELNRYRELYEKDAVSRQELENKERNKDVAEADMKISEKKVQDSILKAPFPGVVAVQYIENYQSVQAKEPIVRIQNNEAIEVVVYVPERDLAVFRTSDLKSAKAVFDAFPDQKFDLKLKEFETQADPVAQTFKVTFTLPRPEDVQVLPGMSATVALQLEPKEGQPESSVFILPASAVTADASGKSFVWIVDKGNQAVSRRDVVLGEVTGTDSIKIMAGLEPGMTVVTTGVRDLREGVKVRPKSGEEKITD